MKPDQAQDAIETDPVLNILAHYGVRGMRWGVRRPVGANGRVSGFRSKSKRPPSTDFKTTQPLRNRPPHTLSNMQLKKVNERMQLETKFNQMNPSRKQKGKKFADEVLKTTVGVGGTAAIVKLATDEKTRAMVKRGAEVIAFRTSAQGRLLNQVRKGRFG